MAVIDEFTEGFSPQWKLIRNLTFYWKMLSREKKNRKIEPAFKK